MALAQWVLEYPAYGRYVRHLGSNKDVLSILDNGAFEGAQPTFEKLDRAIGIVFPEVFVLPDVRGEARETLRLSWESVLHLTDMVPEVMFVPQGKSHEEWKHCLDAWLKQWERSMPAGRHKLVIGITALNLAPSPDSLHRAKAIEYVAQQSLPMHLLGVHHLDTFLHTTLPIALEYDVRSIDTSLPFVLGAKRLALIPGAPKIPLGDINQYSMLSATERQTIRYNILQLREWCNEGYQV